MTPEGHSGQQVAMMPAFMEAAGIEPASRNISTPASTCVVDYLRFRPRPPSDRVRRSPARHFFNLGSSRR